MFNHRTIAVLKREMKAQIFSKAFIFMTILMPVIMFGAYGFMWFVMRYDQDKTTYMHVVSQDQTLLSFVEQDIKDRELKTTNIAFIKINESIDDYIDQNRPLLLGDSLEAVIYLGDSAEIKKTMDYYSKSSNLELRSRVQNYISSAYLKYYLKDQDINKDQLAYIQKRVDVNQLTVKKDSTAENEGPIKYIVAGVFAFLLYLSVLMIGMSAMRSTTEEKINRVVEVLLSSLNTKELMTGKILGSTITGLLQMAIWLSPIILLSLTGLFAAQMSGYEINLSIWQFVYFFVNYLIGLITFVALFAAVGAIFDNDQDAQQGVMPLMMLIMIPFYIAIAIMTNPTNTLGSVASLLPFFSIIVMPVKMSLIETPIWMLFAQLGINLVVMYGSIIMAAKIYHVAILITGKKPSWGQIFKWLKNA